MVEKDKAIQHMDDTTIPFDTHFPRNIWVGKRQAVYERIDTLGVPTEVKKAMREAVTSVIEVCAWCMRERLPVRAILRLADKKCLQIIDAKTEEDADIALNLVHMSKG